MRRAYVAPVKPRLTIHNNSLFTPFISAQKQRLLKRKMKRFTRCSGVLPRPETERQQRHARHKPADPAARSGWPKKTRLPAGEPWCTSLQSDWGGNATRSSDTFGDPTKRSELPRGWSWRLICTFLPVFLTFWGWSSILVVCQSPAAALNLVCSPDLTEEPLRMPSRFEPTTVKVEDTKSDVDFSLVRLLRCNK